MAEKIQLEVVTPTGPVVSEQVEIVTAPGIDGDFGVLANHAPLLSTIKIGALSYKSGNTSEFLMVSGGFCEVSNNKITFLVEAAERGRDIDVDRAMRAKERAEKRVAESDRQQETYNAARAQAALQRALARLKVSKQAS
jgi:F-type H+-transporting ATPase subunit epsilon